MNIGDRVTIIAEHYPKNKVFEISDIYESKATDDKLYVLEGMKPTLFRKHELKLIGK